MVEFYPFEQIGTDLPESKTARCLRSWASRWLLFTPILASLGCAEAPPVLTRAGMTVRDSAGVRIAENTGGAWTQEQAWRVRSRPALTIGTAAGDPEYELYRVRDAARLSDGRIAVVNAGTDEIRIYDQKGRHRVTLGGSGEGPGEFQDPWQMERLPRDSLLVFDIGLRRINIFDPQGRYVRSFRAPPFQPADPELVHWAAGGVVGVFSDGSVLFRPGAWARRRHTVEWTRGMAPLLRCSTVGAVLDTVGVFPTGDVYFSEWGPGPLPFAHVSSFVAAGDQFLVSLGGQIEVAVYDRAGGLVESFRAAHDRRAVTDEDVEAYKRQALTRLLGSVEGTGARARALRKSLDERPFRETMPATRALMVDVEGNVWVELFQAPEEDHPGWYVFRADGQLLGRLDLPSGLRVHEIGSDYVLGDRSDESDVEYVVMYKLEKPG